MTEKLIARLLSLADSGRIREAVKFARTRHEEQVRRGGEPYVNHLVRVAIAVGEYARDHLSNAFEVLVVSGLLHDVLEDTETTYEELLELFGHEVADIVLAVSHENEDEPDLVYLQRVANGGLLAILVKRFDRLDNIRSLRETDNEFRNRKIAQTREMLPIVSSFDPEGARAIERQLLLLERERTHA